MTDFEKQINFIMELDKIKKIGRQTYLSDGSRKENDAEHSWHLALMAFVFADYTNEPIDVLKTMKMVLLHDVIEIDAGDTYAYDTEGNKTKRERELKAADRIFGLLPGSGCRLHLPAQSWRNWREGRRWICRRGNIWERWENRGFRKESPSNPQNHCGYSRFSLCREPYTSLR